jgi:hypothetical protein
MNAQGFGDSLCVAMTSVAVRCRVSLHNACTTSREAQVLAAGGTAA